MQVYAICVPALPGRAAMIVDDRPGACIFWYREDLSPAEVAQMIAQASMKAIQEGYFALPRG